MLDVFLPQTTFETFLQNTDLLIIFIKFLNILAILCGPNVKPSRARFGPRAANCRALI